MSSTNKISVPQSIPTMAFSSSENNQSFNKQLDITEINTIFKSNPKHKSTIPITYSEHKIEEQLHKKLHKKKILAALNKKISRLS